ncbi:hypothetical protein PsorP6_014000 [Peronosclerospora sorghi]|uniref:Uncharacterized protein n=1 Tax=Peronosclerospora sorghi TaxID=230839 RepID=A0ACC0VFV4_9STRA|nr:hypothetical protein PsorP6_014000 [Peronosclerospora sorghi]
MKERMKYWCDLLRKRTTACYSDLRGLFKALIPLRDALQNYRLFARATRYSIILLLTSTFTIDMWILNDTKIDGQFDVFSPKKAHEVFPNAKPIFDILPRIWTESI